MPNHALKRQPAMMMSAAGLVLALVAIMLGPIGLVDATVEGGETCKPVAFRALDTRQPAPGTQLGPAATIDATVVGVGGIPATATSVKVQLTATRQTGGQAPPGQSVLESFLTIYPKGTPRPNVSNLNQTTEHTAANGAQAVAVGAGGMITIYNNAGSTHVIVDVLEWCDEHTHTEMVQIYGETTSVAINDFISPVFVPIASDTFTVPTAGFLHVTGSVSVEDDASLAGNGRLRLTLVVDGVPVLLDSPLGWGIDTEAGAIFANSTSFTAVVPVAAGAHTVRLDAQELGTGTFIRGRSISSIFSPAGGTSTIIPAEAPADQAVNE